MKMKKWSSQWTQFMQLRKEARKKFRTSTGFEPVTSRLPVRCSTNWAMKPLTFGAGQLWVHMFPWKKWVLKSWIFFLRLLYAIAWTAFTATIIFAVHIWFISYIINNLSWQRRPFTCWTMEENYGLLFCFWKVLLVIFFHFSCHIGKTTVCWDPEILLPWQRDVTTSPLY